MRVVRAMAVIGGLLLLGALWAEARYKLRPGEQQGSSKVLKRSQRVSQARAWGFHKAYRRVRRLRRSSPPVVRPVPPSAAPEPAAPATNRGALGLRKTRSFKAEPAAKSESFERMPFVKEEFLERLAQERNEPEAGELPYTRTTIWKPVSGSPGGGGGSAPGSSPPVSTAPESGDGSGAHNRDQGGKPGAAGLHNRDQGGKSQKKKSKQVPGT